MVDTVVAVGTAEVDRVVVAGPIVVVAAVVAAIVAAHMADSDMEIVAGPIVVVAAVVAAIVVAHMADSDMEAVAKFHPFQRYTIHYQSSVYLE